MKRIDIIFTDAVRESAVKTMIQRGTAVADDFIGPSFVAQEGQELASGCSQGVYYVTVRPKSPARGVTCVSPAVQYIYPLHTINRVKESL